MEIIYKRHSTNEEKNGTGRTDQNSGFIWPPFFFFLGGVVPWDPPLQILWDLPGNVAVDPTHGGFGIVPQLPGQHKRLWRRPGI